MFINNPSASSIAGSVWSQAVRTLTADPATDAGAAALVWAHAARTITSLVNVIASSHTNASLGAGATLDLRPPAGQVAWAAANSAAATAVGMYDGTTLLSTNPNMNDGLGDSTVGFAVHNAGGAGTQVNSAQIRFLNS